MSKDYTLPRKTNGSLIAKLRIERGMTQAQLAEKVGVSTQQIGSWETGVRKPKLGAIAKMAEALNVELSVLIEDMV